MSTLGTNPSHRGSATAQSFPQPMLRSPSLAETSNARRSHIPGSTAFKDFMASGWNPPNSDSVQTDEAASYAADRRFLLSRKFQGDYVVLPAGSLKQRSNDTDYRFRPHSAFAYYTGLGLDQSPGAILVLRPVAPGTGDDNSQGQRCAHKSVLYFHPLAGRDTAEFYGDTRYGEFWVGPRPTLAHMRKQLDIDVAPLNELVELSENFRRYKDGGVRVLREADSAITAAADGLRRDAMSQEEAIQRDAALEEYISEARLVKDDWEIEQLKHAIKATVIGFTDVVREIPRALAHPRGERVVEGAFSARAREEGNGLGYDVIAASGNNATTLHWIRNNGKTEPGDLLLLDAGVEHDSLYTADITRTIPLKGTYSPVQRRIYEAVRKAADAAFETVRPGRLFHQVHDAAMKVLVAHLADWGLLPVAESVSLSPEGQHHRRWMPHGTSHHLGIDVHDCAQARSELYIDGKIKAGMIFTIEPGLYFKDDDLLVPEEYRGIGVRIEDDILVSEQGPVNLTCALPREPEDVEAWMRAIWAKDS